MDEKILKHNEFMKKQIDLIIDVCYESINNSEDFYNIDNLIKKLKLVKKGYKKGMDIETAVNTLRF